MNAEQTKALANERREERTKEFEEELLKEKIKNQEIYAKALIDCENAIRKGIQEAAENGSSFAMLEAGSIHSYQGLYQYNSELVHKVFDVLEQDGYSCQIVNTWTYARHFERFRHRQIHIFWDGSKIDRERETERLPAIVIPDT